MHREAPLIPCKACRGLAIARRVASADAGGRRLTRRARGVGDPSRRCRPFERSGPGHYVRALGQRGLACHRRAPVSVQLRGPAIIGPMVQIRGPQALDPNGVQRFADASAMGEPVSVLMVQNWADVSGLTARWPSVLVRPAGSSGRRSPRASCRRRWSGGSELRILIAEAVADVTSLTANWAFF